MSTKPSDRFSDGDTLWDRLRKERFTYDEERDHKVIDSDEDRFERYKGQDEPSRYDVRRKKTIH